MPRGGAHPRTALVRGVVRQLHTGRAQRREAERAATAGSAWQQAAASSALLARGDEVRAAGCDGVQQGRGCLGTRHDKDVSSEAIVLAAVAP